MAGVNGLVWLPDDILSEEEITDVLAASPFELWTRCDHDLQADLPSVLWPVNKSTPVSVIRCVEGDMSYVGISTKHVENCDIEHHF